MSPAATIAASTHRRGLFTWGGRIRRESFPRSLSPLDEPEHACGVSGSPAQRPSGVSSGDLLVSSPVCRRRRIRALRAGALTRYFIRRHWRRRPVTLKITPSLCDVLTSGIPDSAVRSAQASRLKELCADWCPALLRSHVRRCRRSRIKSRAQVETAAGRRKSETVSSQRTDLFF